MLSFVRSLFELDKKQEKCEISALCIQLSKNNLFFYSKSSIFIIRIEHFELL